MRTSAGLVHVLIPREIKMKSFKLTFASALLVTAVTFGALPGSGAGLAFADSKSMAQSDLRVALNQLLAEHAELAAAATGAALGNRPKEFQAAVAALDSNSQDLAKAIGSVYADSA